MRCRSAIARLAFAWYLAETIFAKSNVTVNWNDDTGYLNFYPYVDNSLNPSKSWVGNSDNDDNPDYAFTFNRDAQVSYVFTGNALYYSSPLWPVSCQVYLTISQFQDNKTDGMITYTQTVNLTDPRTTSLAKSFSNGGNDDYSSLNQVLYGRTLPYGTWNVTVEADGDPTHQNFTAFSSFIYTTLTADEVAALDPTYKLPTQNVTLPSAGNATIPTAIAQSEQNSRRNMVIGVSVGVSVGVVGLIFILAAAWWTRQRRLRRVKFTIDDEDEDPSIVKDEKMMGSVTPFSNSSHEEERRALQPLGMFYDARHASQDHIDTPVSK